VLEELTAVLVDATRGALRQRVEGRSSARGTLPSWLLTAADFDVVGIESGSTVLVVEAPSLLEAAPALFGQGQLFEPLDASESAFGVMEHALGLAVDGRSDSDFFDQPLLSTFRRFETLLGGGFSSIAVADENDCRSGVVVDETSMRTVEQLIRNTPEPQRTRVSGKLDTIRHSDRMFTLLMDDGKAVRGIADSVATEQLAGLFGQSVVVSGNAVFRSSGALLRLEADAVDPAGNDAAVWSHIPSPLFRVLDAAVLRQPQGPRTGVNAIIGRWPGDESDEELTAALQELS
jgi:hypothetical protein